MRSIIESEAFAMRLKKALAVLGDRVGSPTRLARVFNRRYPGAPVPVSLCRAEPASAIPHLEAFFPEGLFEGLRVFLFARELATGSTEFGGQR